MKRRDFLKNVLASGALYSSGGLPFLSSVANAYGFASATNRVLVNVMLVGGPDLRYIMPPPFDADSNSYGYKYWEAKAFAHSIGQSASAYQNRWDNDFYPVSDGQTDFGILKSCGWLKSMWDAGNVAVVCNAIGASTRNHAHSQLVMDQGNLGSGPNDVNRSGWGGRLASEAGGNVLALTRSPRRFCYGPDPLDPENHDNSNLVAARNTRELSLFQPIFYASTTSWSRVMTRSMESYYAAKTQDIALDSIYRRFVGHENVLREFGDQVDNRLKSIPLPSSISALMNGGLNDRYFGEQIRNLYDSFASSDILSLRTASLEHGSFDSHKNQRDFIEPKMEDMFGDGKAFDVLYQELPADVKDNMVLVIAGEFGRQLRANGANGCDHGRGNSIIVIGNPVNGGIYGDMFPEGELSRLDLLGADITGLTALDHVFGAASDWVVPGAGDVVFPNRAGAPIEPGVALNSLFV